MTQEGLLKAVTKRLGESEIPYMVTGAYGVIYYGRPRTSHDVDFVVEITQKEVPKFVHMFRKLARGDFLVQEEAVYEAIEKRKMFNVIYQPTLDKLDFWIVKESDFDRESFARRVAKRVLGQNMVLATAEDTILQKLRWYSISKQEKHLIDAAFVWQCQKSLDKSYLKKWAEKLKIEKYLSEIKKINLADYY